MNKEQLRKVEYKTNGEIKIGWFQCWEQVIWNQRLNGGIEDVEAYVCALIENEDGKILQIPYDYIKFIEE